MSIQFDYTTDFALICLNLMFSLMLTDKTMHCSQCGHAVADCYVNSLVKVVTSGDILQSVVLSLFHTINATNPTAVHSILQNRFTPDRRRRN